MISKEKKQAIMAEYARTPGDTGSPEVQVAVLTAKMCIRDRRNCKVRISREGEQIFEGELASLKRFKDDVKEVKAGYECGLVFEDFNDIKEEDRVEAYIMVEVPR